MAMWWRGRATAARAVAVRARNVISGAGAAAFDSVNVRAEGGTGVAIDAHAVLVAHWAPRWDGALVDGLADNRVAQRTADSVGVAAGATATVVAAGW